MSNPSWLSAAQRFVSYVPIALYAESLRINTAIIWAVGSSFAIPPPMTGCVKDLGRLWHLSPANVLSDFHPPGNASGASLRHGNNFPLVNKAVLDRLEITCRRSYYETDPISRPTTLHLTFLVPSAPQPPPSPGIVLMGRAITSAELVIIAIVSALCFTYGSATGGLLLLCLAANTILLLVLQRCSSFVFANAASIEKDVARTAAGGAAIDAHVVAEHWNASDVDVIIGYSSQVHALTNLPIHIQGWKALLWLSRAISGILVVQAAALASQVGGVTDKAWSSSIWLFCYLLMLLVSKFGSRANRNMLLGNQPVKVIRLPPISFKGRRAALAFVTTLPGIERRNGVGVSDWMDGFIPNNERRREWLAEVIALDQRDVEKPSEDAWRILAQIRSARDDSAFQKAKQEFQAAVHLH